MGAFYAVTGSYVWRSLWHRQPLPFVFYIMPLLCFSAAQSLAGGRAPEWATSVELGGLLIAMIAMNGFFYLLLSVVAFGKNALLLDRSPSLMGTYLVGFFLSYTYAFEALGLRDTVAGSMTHRFTDAMYFVTMTFTTVGYGDVVPVNQSGRLLAGFAAINGYMVLAILISVLLPRLLRRAGLRIDELDGLKVGGKKG